MKRRNAIALVAAAVGGTFAVGSGLTAWAAWSVSATPLRETVRAERMPGVDGLAVAYAGGALTFTWDEARFASGASVGGYQVAITGESTRAIVCETAAGTALSCGYSPKGKPSGTFVVRAVAGSAWLGPDSSPVTYVPANVADGQAAAAALPVTGDEAGGSAPEATPGPAAATATPTPSSAATEESSETDSGVGAEETPDSAGTGSAAVDPVPAESGGADDPVAAAE